MGFSMYLILLASLPLTINAETQKSREAPDLRSHFKECLNGDYDYGIYVLENNLGHVETGTFDEAKRSFDEIINLSERIDCLTPDIVAYILHPENRKWQAKAVEEFSLREDYISKKSSSFKRIVQRMDSLLVRKPIEYLTSTSGYENYDAQHINRNENIPTHYPTTGHPEILVESTQYPTTKSPEEGTTTVDPEFLRVHFKECTSDYEIWVDRSQEIDNLETATFDEAKSMFERIVNLDIVKNSYQYDCLSTDAFAKLITADEKWHKKVIEEYSLKYELEARKTASIKRIVQHMDSLQVRKPIKHTTPIYVTPEELATRANPRPTTHYPYYYKVGKRAAKTIEEIQL